MTLQLVKNLSVVDSSNTSEAIENIKQIILRIYAVIDSVKDELKSLRARVSALEEFH